MNKDAGTAIVALGVLVGGGVLAKAAFDDLYLKKGPPAPKQKIPLSPVDRVVQFGVTAFFLGGTLMKLYDWVTQNKVPSLEDML